MRQDKLIPLLLSLAFLQLYLATLCPTIYPGDDGDLATGSFLLGNPHPSAYPLYVQSAHGFMRLLPLGNPAGRGAIWSALCAAAAVGLGALAVRRLGGGRLGTLAVGLALGSMPVLWRQAGLNRVYALNLFLMLAAILAAGSALESNRRRDLAAAGLLAGLAGTNHLAGAVVGIILAVLLILRRAGWKALATLVLAGMLGGSVYLALPIRAVTGPEINWEDPRTWESFQSVLLRQGFWYKTLIESPTEIPDLIRQLAPGLLEAVTLPVALAALLGLPLVLLRRRSRHLGLLVLGSALGSGFLVLWHGCRYDLFSTQRYFLPILALGILPAGAPLGWLENRLSRISVTPLRHGLVGVLAAGILMLGAGRVVHEFHRQDCTDITIGYDYGHNLFRCLPPGSQLTTLRDNEAFLTAYLQLVEGVRPDVTLYHQAGKILLSSREHDLVYDNNEARILLESRVVDRAPDRSYYCEPWAPGTLPNRTLLPWGFVYRTRPSSAELESFPGQNRFTYRSIYRADHLEDHMVGMIQQVYRRSGQENRSLRHSIEEARCIRERFDRGEGSRQDREDLRRIYRSAGLVERLRQIEAKL